jgi:5-formyltetrahydrofolate cyclo-ligase
MDADLNIAADKALARKAAFAARKQAFVSDQAAETIHQANAHLQHALAKFAGKTLAGYMPMRTEIDPLPAMWAHQGPLAVPVIAGPAQPLRFAAYHRDCAMEMGAFGALIPAVLHDIVPDVLVIPLLAYDMRGYRLGYGGGFYDRTLQMLRAGPTEICAIGFAFAAQMVERVPTDANDQRLDMIVNEHGATRFDG